MTKTAVTPSILPARSRRRMQQTPSTRSSAARIDAGRDHEAHIAELLTNRTGSAATVAATGCLGSSLDCVHPPVIVTHVRDCHVAVAGQGARQKPKESRTRCR